jgi:glycogen debranching enzyme
MERVYYRALSGQRSGPGEYHNGGIWPFICGLYVAALVTAKKYTLAEEKLLALTEMVRAANKKSLAFGFNEWLKAQDATPRGQDWQTWSAALYLYATKCVAEKRTPFFDEVRSCS